MNIVDKLIKAFLKDRNCISLQDRMVLAYLKGKPMPLKGHTRIIFTDTVTGEEKVVADTTNMVTNAVANLLSKNWCGLASISSLLPLKQMYSGVLCFQNEITENADNYLPPDDVTNPLIAHASQQANETLNTLRGSPVTSDIVETDTSVKWVWSWDSSHGNGTIRTVCLCPNIFGSMGLKPTADALYNPLSRFGASFSQEGTTWNETVGYQYPWSISDDGKTCKTLWCDGTTFHENTVRHDFFAFGIMRDPTMWQYVSTRSATIRTFTNNKSFIFSDDDYYYVAKITSATEIQMDKISKEDMTVTQNDITLSGVSLYTGNLAGGKSNALCIFPFDGTYLYLPNSDKNGFIRTSLNGVDVAIIQGTISNLEVGTNLGFSSGNQFMSPIVLGSKLILGSNYIINGNNAYQIAHCNSIGIGSSSADNSWVWLVQNGVTCYGHGKQTSLSSVQTGQSNVLNAMFLSTINVLEEPVTKTNTVAMRIEYTISET